jgi:hypothetical protein
MQIIAFLGRCGPALLLDSYVVGVEPIFLALSRVGFGFFIVVGANGARHVLRTIAMRLAVAPEHRRFSFMQAFAARLGGESLGFLTFAGPLLGEATKVALLRKRVPLVHGVPALVVDNLLYNLSVVLIVFGGCDPDARSLSRPGGGSRDTDRHRRGGAVRPDCRDAGHAQTRNAADERY